MLSFASMLTHQNIDRVLEFEPLFARPADDWKFDRWGISTQFQPFISLLYDEQFVIPFDWATWSLQFGRTKMIAPAVFEDADLEMIQKLVTSAIRMERHSDRLHEKLVQLGWFTAMFQRLKELREVAAPS